MTGIVIIGGGQAAAQNAACLRQEGFTGEITVFSDEQYVPYQRPPLSKDYLAGKHDIERLFLRPASFYEEKNIDLRLSARVSEINREQKNIKVSSGETVPYEKLLIATGSRPRLLKVPGNQLAGIHYLRQLNDVNSIKTELNDRSNICIVGGGYIGLEVAAVMIAAGHDVTVVESENRVLQRVTTPQMSSFFHNLHESKGVKIYSNTTVCGFSGEKHVEYVNCGDLTIRADLVIVGIGVIPNTELAHGSGLQCDNGIIVNDRCQTSDTNIFAAGDNTNHPNTILNRRLRLESVPNAMEQARVSAKNMLGQDQIYRSLPWFWSNQYELRLQMLGFSMDGDSQVIRGDIEKEKFAIFYLNKDKVVAVDAVNSPAEFMIGKKLYGKAVDPMNLGNLKFNLENLI